ncbi:two-component system, CitB family, response regulator MalR [Treponema bryantii]|uniref:Transcriptional regulatory protein n=1 Tax=Treponema bryantii TaxID=163 RepID=A0A1I3L9V7_9SPIR|nr:response regulator [Treponema bryantii]SFI81527.1 two-component system, CitB family, response regulator MalR [Treponema bryantii]
MYKVLIVEDDPMVAMINEQYVCKNKDFCVQKTCRNGQEALEYLEETNGTGSKDSSIDLVIMDVFMPLMNGVETLKKIREKKLDCEVIMVTAANDPATLEETMHLGVIDFLIKPFAYERFQVALEKFIANDQAFRGAQQTIDQNYVDSLISNGGQLHLQNNELPKGIQKKTLDLLTDYLKEKKGWVSGDQISEDVGLSSVTVRHYMSYLVEKGEVNGEINYETGGRPSMLYRFVL